MLVNKFIIFLDVIYKNFLKFYFWEGVSQKNLGQNICEKRSNIVFLRNQYIICIFLLYVIYIECNVKIGNIVDDMDEDIG